MKVGTPVGSAYGGTVIDAGMNGEIGGWVKVQHPGGRTTRYVHLSSVGVKIGDQISTGQIVGKSGGLGIKLSTGAHLHFELKDSLGNLVDPARYLNSMSPAERKAAQKNRPKLGPPKPATRG